MPADDVRPPIPVRLADRPVAAPETTVSCGLGELVGRAVADYHTATWERRQIAVEDAAAILAAREFGDDSQRAQGVREGLRLAASILLTRAGIGSGRTVPDGSGQVRTASDGTERR